MENSSFIKTIPVLALVALASILPYLHTLDAPFVHDDLHSIRDNPPLRHHSHPADFFTRPELFSGTKAEMYRPLLQLSYVLNFRLGSSPYGFRVVNLILHALCALLVFFLTRSIPGLERISLPASLLFALHPAHTKTVIYLSSRSTLLASFFILLGLVSFILAVRKDSSSRKYRLFGLASIICLVMGLASKSTAVTLPALALAYSILFPCDRKSRGMAIVFGLFLVSACYILLRYSLGLYTFFPPETTRPVITNLLTQARVSFFYLRLILWPVHLSMEYDVDQIRSVFHPAFLLSMLGWLALVCIGLVSAGKKPAILFSVIIFMISLAPTSTLIPLVVIAGENRIYLASLGVIWPLSIIFLTAFEFLRGRVAVIVIFVFILACLCGLTADRGSVWNSSMGLWRDAVKKSPGLARVLVNHGIELKNRMNYPAAIRQYEWAIRIDPRNSRAYSNLGNIYSDQRRYKLAKKAYGQAIGTAHGNVNARINLSRLMVETGKPEAAASLLEETLLIAPLSAVIHHDLGIIYMRHLRDWRKARGHLERSLELDPGQRDADMIRRAIVELRKLENIQGRSDPRAR